jgi:hypothetical protein
MTRTRYFDSTLLTFPSTTTNVPPPFTIRFLQFPLPFHQHFIRPPPFLHNPRFLPHLLHTPPHSSIHSHEHSPVSVSSVGRCLAAQTVSEHTRAGPRPGIYSHMQAFDVLLNVGVCSAMQNVSGLRFGSKPGVHSQPHSPDVVL